MTFVWRSDARVDGRGQLVLVNFPFSIMLALRSNLGCQPWQLYVLTLHCLVALGSFPFMISFVSLFF